MKIVSLKKIKPEIYTVLFDNGSEVLIYEKVIVDYRLLNRDIDNDLYEEILKENEIAKLEYEAIKYISKKMHSEKEIYEYLIKKTNEEEIINNVIGKLKKINLINDELYAKAYASDKYNIGKYGRYKIIHGLEEQNIDEEVIKKAVSFITDEEQISRIKAIVDKYIKTNKKDSSFRLKDKIYTNLVNKGYPKELIIETINNIKDSNNDVLKKQYLKLLKNYEAKYKGEILNKKVKEALYKKGFSVEEIKKLEI